MRHGGEYQRVELAEADVAFTGPSDDVLALDEALQQFEHDEPRKAALVKLRYFAGLNEDDAAAALGISLRHGLPVVGLCPSVAVRTIAQRILSATVLVLSCHRRVTCQSRWLAEPAPSGARNLLRSSFFLGALDRLLSGLDLLSRNLCGLRGSFVSVRRRLFPEAAQAFKKHRTLTGHLRPKNADFPTVPRIRSSTSLAGAAWGSCSVRSTRSSIGSSR